MRSDRPRAKRAPPTPTPAPPPPWYALGWLLGLPAVALYLSWRALRQREYLRHWSERFLGRGQKRAAPQDAPLLWIHAVSVGETRAASPLIEELARRHPDAYFVLTHMTPTGRAAGAALAQRFAGRVQQRYLPYDLPFAVQAFLDELRPSAGILMETEIWPQLVHGAHARGVPLVLVNARLSQRSLSRALDHGSIVRAAAACLQAVGAQSPEDARRIGQLYDGELRVTGNLKFDLHPDAAQLDQGGVLRARFAAAAARIWLFASTREGEERLLLDALQAGEAAAGQAATARGAAAPLLLFVPRHPQRFDEVEALLRERGLRVLRRAQWTPYLSQQPSADASADSSAVAPRPVPDARLVLLGDSMGEMPLYYAMADAALIGGSLLALGGQNLIEACACGCPVVLGPHMFNFAQASEAALAAGAARSVAGAREALQALEQISADPVLRSAMSAAALAFACAHRGATARTADLIEQVWGARESARAARSGVEFGSPT